ncbi:MAG: hypothetical protein U1F06_02920 [Steroidobacteraceae bacterium]
MHTQRIGNFEHVSQPLLHRRQFARRVARSGLLGAALIALALLLGMAGYHWLLRLPWVDAFENASMILSGMGPLSSPPDTLGKIFAGSYALFSGFAVILCSGVVFAPVLHRFLHRLHLAAGTGR